MPYEIEVDPATRLATLRGYGETSVEESHANLVALAAHPDFEPGFALLCDLRELKHESDTRDIMENSKNTLRFRELLTGRVAVVANEALALPAELSAAITSAEGIQQRVFRDYHEARAWALGGGEAASPAV